MISRTITIPRLGMTFDADKVATTDFDLEYQDCGYESYSWSIAGSRYIDRTITTFRFHDGTTMTVHNAEYTLEVKVELEEGRMYQLGKDGKKWLALCRFDDQYNELTLFPTDRRRNAPLVKNSDRMDYTFYKEFEHDYKEYL